MHITIFVYGTWGDLRPHVVLGQALQAAGHEVQVVASPGYEQWVRDRNLGFYPLTTDVNTFSKENAAIMDESVWQQLQIARNVLQPIFTQMGLEVLEATRESDVLITVEIGVPLVIDVVKANQLKLILLNPANLSPTREFSSALPPAPDWFPFKDWYNNFSYTIIRRISWSVLGKPRKEISKKLGIPTSTFKDLQALLTISPALTIVSKHVQPRPADWGDNYQVTGYLFDDDPEWTAPQDLIDFLAEGEAPVYIGFGSMADSKPQITTQLMIEAVQKAGKRAVILSGWARLGVDQVPENIHILNYAPHSWLFPKMAALIHHGGAGTTASGLKAGIPTTIIPHTADQPYWGRVVKQLGIGTNPIPRKKLTVDNLSQAIQTLTSDQTLSDNAKSLGTKIQQEDGLAEAMTWMEHYLSQFDKK